MKSIIRQRISEDSILENKSLKCHFPKNMLLEVTNACNDSCLFCANSKCTKKKRIIDKNFAMRMLEQAYKFGTREVGFYGTGEPLLDTNLEDYIVYAKKLGYDYVYITTNGSLLSKERAESIVESGIDSIKFSVNASNAKDYLLIHGTDDFDKVMENLIYLDTIRKKNKKNIALYISYVMTRYTNKEKEKFKDVYGKYVNDIVFYECLNTGGYMSNEFMEYLSADHNIKVPFKNDICPMIFKNLYITCDGYLTMCCIDFQNYLAIADLNQESLHEAWNNSYACDLRKRHLEHNLKGTICYNCINNCHEPVRPLKPELAIFYDNEMWSKEKEIQERIKKWLLKEKG